MAPEALLVAVGTCTMAGDPFSNGPGRPVDACGEAPVLAVITFGCRHEHVDTALSCAACAAEIQRIADVLVCPRREEGPQPHECPVTMSIRWLEAPNGI